MSQFSKETFILFRIFVVLSFLHCTSSLNINSRSSVISSFLCQFKKCKHTLSSAIILSTIIWSSPEIAHSVIAPLADVGIKEFLVKDGNQFLRISQPSGREMKLGASSSTSFDRAAQEAVELVRLRFEQVGNSNPSVWGSILSDANNALTIITKNKDLLIQSANDPTIALQFYEEKLIPSFSNLADAIKKHDVDRSIQAQDDTASLLSELRSMSLPPNSLPFDIPAEYSNLPKLNGRATVKMTIKSKNGFRLNDGKSVVPIADFDIEVDGFHAPLTAGNFIDLVDMKFYDNMPIQKAEELIVQTGKPVLGDGYIDPRTKTLREIPLELFYKQDTQPAYGITSDDDQRSTETTTLPFQAFGALGMARNNEQVDSASSQIFFLKWNQALIAPGRNTLDGFYSCFGYITSKNEYLLSQLTTDDVILSAKVTSGLSNLVR